jgi:hypothetical protein
MNNSITGRLGKVIDQAPVWILLILGIWLVILRPLGPHLALVPGDLGDARFNNFILEHFFQWVTGITRDYWNAPFFYPYQQTITFGDNLLGSAPFYALFRGTGLNRESAFQGWYILGYVLNFIASGYVLWCLKLKSLAIGAGAFFFTFGLPLLAQENHVQLIYRFCIPLACYSLWRFYQQPRLKYLIGLGAWLGWQFYLTIYMGIFLGFLLAILFVLLPLFVPAQSFLQRLAIWPRCIIESWSRARLTERLLTLAILSVLGFGFVMLILPYYRTTRMYSFSRNLFEVLVMLPRIKSYLLAENSQLWRITARLFPNFPLRWEHQLFPGLAVVILVLAGMIGRFSTPNRTLAWLHLTAALALIALTLEIHGLSLYLLLWLLPGINSIRAVTRVMLVVMWPLSLFIAWVIDGLMQRSNQQRSWMQIAVYLVVGLLVVESVFYDHTTYLKADGQARLDKLIQQIPAIVPGNPILFVAENPQEPHWAKDIDAMLLSQELGWSTLNGYSGNYPPGYWRSNSCEQLPARIKSYMKFVGISSESFYLEMMKRIVPIGFTNCDPSWWEKMP